MIGMNLKREIDQIAKDKGIDGTEITGALEEAMLQAARKRFGLEKEIEARYNDEIGEVELFEFREVVEEITDADSQILIAEAQRDYDPDVEIGDDGIEGTRPLYAGKVLANVSIEDTAFFTVRPNSFVIEDIEENGPRTEERLPEEMQQ